MVEQLYLRKENYFVQQNLCQESVGKIGDLTSETGEFYSLAEINNRFNIKWTFLDFLRIRLTIPLAWRQLLSGEKTEGNELNTLYGRLCNLKTLKSKDLYWLLLENKYDIICKPKAQSFWENKCNFLAENFENIYTLPYKVIRLTNIQSMQFKILYKIFNCNYWLHKIKILDSPGCRFCNEVETLDHYFFSCKVTNEFWAAFMTWWNSHDVPFLETLSEIDVLLGLLCSHEVGNILNCCLLIAKWCIYTSKSLNKQPNLYAFHYDLNQFLRIEEQIAIQSNNHELFLTKWDFIKNNLM